MHQEPSQYIKQPESHLRSNYEKKNLLLALRAERNIFLACEVLFSASTKAFSNKNKTKKKSNCRNTGWKIQFPSG